MMNINWCMTMVDYFGTYREKEDNQFLLFVIIVIFLILYEKLIYIYIYINKKSGSQ